MRASALSAEKVERKLLRSGSKYAKDFVKTRAFRYMLEKFPEMFNKNRFVKEITEAWGARNAIKGVLIESGEEYIVVDAGSGAGYFTVLTALFHPATKVFAVDTHTEFAVEDFRDLKNAERVRMDLFSEEFEKFLSSFKKVILVGIHLCSDLALRFIDLANRVESVRHAVLIPCCVGDREEILSFGFIEDTYEMWCAYLVSKIDTEKFRVISRRDPEILSPKNVVIKMRERVK